MGLDRAHIFFVLINILMNNRIIIFKTNKIIKIIVFTLNNLLFIKSFEQENNENVEPRGEWCVSKEYDDQGNMISYDSVYVWSSGRITDFDFFKNNRLAHDFKEFVRDFEIPKFNFIERNSLGLGIRDIFQGF